MKLSIAAMSGKVAFVGNKKVFLLVTPEVAEQLAADLPNKAAVARSLAANNRPDPRRIQAPILLTGAN